MTIHKKDTKMKKKGAAQHEVAATTSTTAETVEVVASTSVVEESRQVSESECRSSTVEVTSTSREVVMDSKGNVIKVIETPPQIVQQSSSSRKTGQSSQDFIAGEQSMRQAKTTREIPPDHVKSLSDGRVSQGETSERRSVETRSQIESRSTAQQSITTSTSVESTSAEDHHGGHRSIIVLSHDTRNGEHAAPASIQTSSRSTESSRASSERSEAITKDGQTVSSTTRIRETGERVDDNGRTMSTSSREVDSERTVTPSDVTAIKSGGKSGARADSKTEKSSRCNKPGQSTWDGTFVYEKPVTPKSKGAPVGKTVTPEIHEKVSLTDQIVSSAVTRDSRIIDESRELSATDTERGSRARHSKPGDSAWDGSFVAEKTPQPRRRNDSDAEVFHHGRGDNVVETTERRDFQERSADGTYAKESSETVRVVKGATDSTAFISEERRDVSRESSIRIDGTPSGKEEHPARVSSPSRRGAGGPPDATVVRRTEKRHDSVDVQDVTEEQNVSNITESVSTSYIVEYAISGDKRNVEKITSVSDVILEEGGSPEERTTARRGSPEGRDVTTRCYKPGQSAWDGTFVYEQPRTPDSRRRPEERRAMRSVDIRDVTEDNSINEASVTSASYIVEHSSSQQSFSDVRDASLTSTIYETVVYEGRPVETTIRFDEGTSREKISRPSPSPRSRSPEKAPRDLRGAKPGSSTWDGTFVRERSQETKRPPSRESIGSPDKLRSVGGKKDAPAGGSPKKYVSETTIDLRDVARDVSSTSKIAESSVVVEQSRSTHESHADSASVDFSTTSVETVIIRDGQPVTVKEGPRGPAKGSTVGGSELKERRTDDRNYRPTKPGSSTWDGSFKREHASSGIAHKQSPSKEKPTDRTFTISDSSKGVTSSAEYSASSATVERTFVIEDSQTHDSSNISKVFIEERVKDEIDYEKARRISDEKPRPSPRQRPDDVREPKDEKSQKSPADRTLRPSKPGASTWDGSFVCEKPEEKKPGDRRVPKDTFVTVDRQSPVREQPSDKTDYRTSITILDASKDVTSSADYSTSSVTIERASAIDSRTRDSSNISKIYIEDHTSDKIHPADHARPSDEKPKPSSRQRPEDAKGPGDEKPQTSPADRTQRPSKPGASTWDGSFVYEKPQDLRKKPADEKTTGESRKPADQKLQPTPTARGPTDGKAAQLDVTEIRYVGDAADITRTSQMVQKSSYVIDQSSSFTSVQDVRNITDERVIAEFTADTAKDVVSNGETLEYFISFVHLQQATICVVWNLPLIWFFRQVYFNSNFIGNKVKKDEQRAKQNANILYSLLI